jgi:hypothetical protein
MIKRTYSIDSELLDLLINSLDRAAYYCQHATSSINTSWEDEPTASYPGASGYAGATAARVSEYLKQLQTN